MRFSDPPLSPHKDSNPEIQDPHPLSSDTSVLLRDFPLLWADLERERGAAGGAVHSGRTRRVGVRIWVQRDSFTPGSASVRERRRTDIQRTGGDSVGVSAPRTTSGPVARSCSRPSYGRR